MLFSFVAIISSLFLSSVFASFASSASFVSPASAKEVLKNQDLITASRNGEIDKVKQLLEQEGIDVNVQNFEGYTALMLASMYGYADVVELLLEQEGIDVNAQNSNGYTALMWASRFGHTDIVKLLLEHINKVN